jgi:predicted metalloprotease
LQYWRTHGGLPQQGFPISDPFVEVSELNGQPYLVQYFERAVFEYHPENRPPHDVLLSQLGTFRLQAAYPNGLAFPDADGDGVSDSADRCPGEKENLNKIFDIDGCPDTMDDLIGEAGRHINSFWQEVFQAAGVEYIPPREIVPYTRPIQTACGRAALNNAFYCSRSHGIYLDYNFLAEQLYTDGDFAPVTILAHEWGHLVQANLGILQSNAFYSIEIELQADCLAGVWAYRAGEDQMLEEGDLDEAAVSLFKAGDDIDTPWFDPRAHGRPEQRIEAFSAGFDGGVEACEIGR